MSRVVLLIGITDEHIIKSLRDNLRLEFIVLKESAREHIIEDIVKAPQQFEGYENWHHRKFVLMHDLENEEIKKVLSEFKRMGLKDAIFATTTKTSLKWKLGDLLEELIKEDEYFKKGRN